MSKSEEYVPPRDRTMNDLYSMAEELGPPPKLPESLKDAQHTAAFIDYADKEIINPFRTLGKKEFILKVAELTKERIPDVADGNTRANLTMRLHSGCLDSAKTIRDTSVAWYPDGTSKLVPITPEERKAGCQHMQISSKDDPIYQFGVELGPVLRKIREQPTYAEGVPDDSPVRRYIKAGIEGNVISPEDIVV